MIFALLKPSVFFRDQLVAGSANSIGHRNLTVVDVLLNLVREMYVGEQAKHLSRAGTHEVRSPGAPLASHRERFSAAVGQNESRKGRPPLEGAVPQNEVYHRRCWLALGARRCGFKARPTSAREIPPKSGIRPNSFAIPLRPLAFCRPLVRKGLAQPSISGLRPLPDVALASADFRRRLLDRLLLAQLFHSPKCRAAPDSSWRVKRDKVMNVNPGTKEKNVMIITKMIMPTATTHKCQGDWHNLVNSCMRLCAHC